MAVLAPIGSWIAANAGTIAAVGAAAVGATAAVRQGQAAKKTAEYNADIMAQQADQERQASRQEEREFRDRNRRLLAAGRARSGASGFTMAGSPLLIAEDMASEVELQALKIRYGGDIKATRLEQQAGITSFEGQQAYNQGTMRAGASLLSSAGKSYGGSSASAGTSATQSSYASSGVYT